MESRQDAAAQAVRTRQLRRITTLIRYFLIMVLIIFGLGALFAGGIYIGSQKMFPYHEFAKLKYYISKSIGQAYLRKHQAGLSQSQKDRISHFESFSPRRDFVMVGDSITENGIWQEIFTTKLVANRGVKSDTSWHVLNRIQTIINVKPKKAFLMFGINDVKKNIPIKYILQNYKATVLKLRKNGIEVVVQSTIECSLKHCGKTLKAIRNLNAELKRFARRSGILFVDLNEGLASPATGLLQRYTSDGTHLLGNGYSVWAGKIENLLK